MNPNTVRAIEALIESGNEHIARHAFGDMTVDRWLRERAEARQAMVDAARTEPDQPTAA